MSLAKSPYARPPAFSYFFILIFAEPRAEGAPHFYYCTAERAS